MDLTRQPPRRPTNLSVAGIVGAARLTDKARAHNAETLGEYLYGENSGLDQRVLTFLGISDDTYAEAADEHDDAALGQWVLETTGKTEAEIAAFNAETINLNPDTEGHKQRLKERLARYAPGRTDITTGTPVDGTGRLGKLLAGRPHRRSTAECACKRHCWYLLVLLAWQTKPAPNAQEKSVNIYMGTILDKMSAS